MNKSIDNQSFGLPMPLPLELKKCGFLLKQAYKGTAAVLYTVTDIVTGKEHGYEVFELRIQQAKTLPNGVTYPHKERYPPSEAFGKWAFAPNSQDRAIEIFLEMELREVAKMFDLGMTSAQIAKNLVNSVS